MITIPKFDRYFKHTQKLAFRLESDGSARTKLLHLIESENENADEDLPYMELLKGEHAFFTGRYQHALKHYLQAKAFPHFQLFCFRASAYVFMEREAFDKAINFANQALNICPEDYPSLFVLEELLTRVGQHEHAKEIYNQIKELEEKYSHINSIFEANDETIQIHAPTEISTILEETLENEEIFESPRDPIELSQSAHLDVEALFNTHIIDDIVNKCDESNDPSQDHFKPALPTELTMNPRTDFFAPVEGNENPALETLTQRLYSKNPEALTNPSDIYLAESPTFSTFAAEHENQPSHSPYMTTPKESKESLEESIKLFQQKQAELVAHYLERFKKRKKLHDHCLYALHGWNAHQLKAQQGGDHLPLLTDRSRKTSGGFYFRWNNKGIVINPGTNFLDNFHQQGLHIKDIDYVIVSGDHPDTYSDIKEIYDLNYQLNKVNPELQIINYYLSQKAYQALSRTLKPNFKQERNTVHCLELFLDSPDVEKAELGEGITLNYFPVLTQDTFFQNPLIKEERNPKIPACLGIRFDLKTVADKTPLRIGYVSNAPWSPLLAHHLGHCELLITGFGNTNPNDYGKLKYNDDCLGYYGSYSLLEEINPKVLLCTEFDGNEGDIRIEVVKQLRQDFAHSQPNRSSRSTPAILAADTKLYLNLKTMEVQCTISQTLVSPSDVHVVKSAENFGSLNYLSPRCFA